MSICFTLELTNWYFGKLTPEWFYQFSVVFLFKHVISPGYGVTSLWPRLFHHLSIIVVVTILLSCVLVNNKLQSNFVDNILLLHSESAVLGILMLSVLTAYHSKEFIFNRPDKTFKVNILNISVLITSAIWELWYWWRGVTNLLSHAWPHGFTRHFLKP